jgi:hypothetical protein
LRSTVRYSGRELRELELCFFLLEPYADHSALLYPYVCLYVRMYKYTYLYIYMYMPHSNEKLSANRLACMPWIRYHPIRLDSVCCVVGFGLYSSRYIFLWCSFSLCISDLAPRTWVTFFRWSLNARDSFPSFTTHHQNHRFFSFRREEKKTQCHYVYIRLCMYIHACMHTDRQTDRHTDRHCRPLHTNLFPSHACGTSCQKGKGMVKVRESERKRKNVRLAY